ncbi:MAG: pilus assembly protein [Comamonas sp.]
MRSRIEPRPPTHGTGRQRGAALLVVLMMLAVVSLLGAAAVQMAILGERSARNDRDDQIAWQAAEAALADAEFDIEGESATGTGPTRGQVFTGQLNNHDFVAGCGDEDSGNSWGLCQTAASGSAPVWQQVDLGGALSVPLGTFTQRHFDHGSGLRPARAPRYIIEQVSDNGASADADLSRHSQYRAYRITAIGFGPRESTQVVLQSVYRK